MSVLGLNSMTMSKKHPKKQIYFIDYENTPKNILDLLAALCPLNSWYFIFYSQNTPQPEWVLTHMPSNLHKTSLKFIHCEKSAHNAMDFQIVAEIAYLGAQYKNAIYTIISDDKGYDAAICQLRKHGISINRMSPYGKIAHITSTNQISFETCIRNVLKANGQQSQTAILLKRIGNDYNLVAIHNAIQEIWRKSMRRQLIYKEIKKELRKYGLV